nr:UPF0262 family protein [Ensifer sp. BR816]
MQHKNASRPSPFFDLLDNNRFAPVEHGGGPYRLRLSLVDKRLAMSVTTENGAPVQCHHLSLTSFRRLLKDYRLVCESYAGAESRLTPDRLEAFDMGRRSIHDEASALLKQPPQIENRDRSGDSPPTVHPDSPAGLSATAWRGHLT